MVHVEIGIGEIMGILGSIVAFGWALMKMTLNQFEKRLDQRFATMDGLLLDVKKLELEQVRKDGHYSQMFATKDDLLRHQDRYEKTVERIFSLLSAMNDKLDGKVSHEECEKQMLRKTDRIVQQ